MPKCRVKRHAVTQPLDKSYRLIPLTQGQNAIVDVEDFDWLSQWNWYAKWAKCTQSFYAMRKEQSIKMHREIMKCKSQKEVDHKNHNTLDNRKENLRICTHSQNIRNGNTRVTNTSGFTGVSWHKRVGKWGANIHSGGRGEKTMHIGYFLTPEEAARAYDSAAKLYHGEFARLNFPKIR